MSSSATSLFPDVFYIICAIEPFKKNLKIRVSKNASIDKLVTKIEEYFDCKILSVYICSSAQLILDYKKPVYDIICPDLVTDTIVNDAIVAYVDDKYKVVDVDSRHIMKDNLLRKDIVRYIVSSIIKRIIYNAEPLDKYFEISRKQRKDKRGDEVTYTWKDNPYVVFRSEKKARLFLMHGK